MAKQKKQPKRQPKQETSDDKTRAKDQARAQLNSILEMMKAYQQADETGEEVVYEGDKYTADHLRTIIEQNALSVETRADWHTPGGEDDGDTEYRILLCTGGPAVQIVGELTEHNDPENARLQYQDWFTPWEDYRDTTDEEDEILLRYVQFHYFGQ